MKSLYFLHITGDGDVLDKYLKIFRQLPGGKSTDASEFSFFNISTTHGHVGHTPLNFLNTVLISGAKFDGQRGTWTGCLYARDRLKDKSIFY